MAGLLAMIVYIGCYTDAAHPNGLYAVDLDPASGAMSVMAAQGVEMAIYQALSPDGGMLYTCACGGLMSLRASGAGLSPVDTVDLGGTPCHVSVSGDGARVFWADYANGRAGSVRVSPEGRFGEVTRHQHSGSGPNLPRQDRAHCHQAVPTPEGEGYCVVDLGLDEIVAYPWGVASPTSPRGAGPRHVVFHPNGRLGFLAFELGNMVSSFRWDSSSHSLAILDTLPTLPPGDTGRGYNGDLAAAVRLTPGLDRVVVSNRGENSLVSYRYDEATGALSDAVRTLLPGSWPRDLAFVARDLALVTMERTGEVHSLRYDPATGRFALLATLGGFYRPVAALAAGDR